MPPRVRPLSSYYFLYQSRTQHIFSFSTSTPRLAAEATYYEILDVPVTASAAEIKKKFYTLSLRHHPDRNRSDPTASERFARISSAYHVLGDKSKRAAYDRDHGIHAARADESHSPHQARGSYSSYSSSNVYHKGESYAGSRPASGLSKRRGTFRGPPPSFYAHGGFGRQPHPPPSGGGGGGGGGGQRTAGTRDEEDPTSFIDRNPVYHFNARGHFRTQSAEDLRRRARRSRAMGAAIREHQVGTAGDVLLRFIIVCGMLVGTVFISGLTGQSAKGEDEKGKTSRRKEG